MEQSGDPLPKSFAGRAPERAGDGTPGVTRAAT